MSAEQLADSERLGAVRRYPAPLFVYGSLLFPEVLEVLIDRDPDRVPAVLSGWRIIAIPGKLYPGLVPSDNASASGHLLTDLTDREWRTLDAFESDFYNLYKVSTVAGESAWAYVLHGAEAPVAEWDSQAFMRESLATYLDTCGRWREQFDPKYDN